MNIFMAKLLFYILAFSVILIRFFYQKQYQSNTIVESRFDLQEKIVLWVTVLGLGGIPLLYLLTPLFRFADYSMPIPVSLVGICLLFAASWLFWRSHRDLGRNWSPSLEIQKNHVLIQNGVYATIRHPMYASLWLWTLAQIMVLPNWVVGPAGIVAFALLYFTRIHKEEKMMMEIFGDEYKVYADQTKRIIPHLF